jgi:hypothetical protein
MGIKQEVELAADIRVLLTRLLVHSPTVDLLVQEVFMPRSMVHLLNVDSYKG